MRVGFWSVENLEKEEKEKYGYLNNTYEGLDP